MQKLEKNIEEAEKTQSMMEESQMVDPKELQNLTARRDALKAQLDALNAEIEAFF